MRRKSQIERVSYQAAYGQAFDDLARRVPKLDRVRAAIGFKPAFDLDEIIGSVVGEL